MIESELDVIGIRIWNREKCIENGIEKKKKKNATFVPNIQFKKKRKKKEEKKK